MVQRYVEGVDRYVCKMLVVASIPHRPQIPAEPIIAYRQALACLGVDRSGLFLFVAWPSKEMTNQSRGWLVSNMSSSTHIHDSDRG